ncbi:MAG: hypothetical protein HRT66_04205, partial [Flavobacteriaceae bacterium]|nr:hypothetical protein [Flavobacteriaceae bacterium]
QDISGIATNATDISNITGLTSGQITLLSNTTGENTGDQDISGIATNATAIGLNTAKACISKTTDASNEGKVLTATSIADTYTWEIPTASPNIPDYDSGKTYSALSVVYAFDGYIYRSLVDNNIGNLPDLVNGVFENSFWEIIVEGKGRPWDASVYYVAGNEVYHNGESWECWADNANKEPQKTWVNAYHHWHIKGTTSYTYRLIITGSNQMLYEDPTLWFEAEGSSNMRHTRFKVDVTNNGTPHYIGDAGYHTNLTKGVTYYININSSYSSAGRSNYGALNYYYNYYSTSFMLGNNRSGDLNTRYRRVWVEYVGGGSDNQIVTIKWERL